MKKLFYLLMLIMFFVLSYVVFATPFDNSTGVAAVAILDGTGAGDYTTLAAASTAFNTVVGGINRAWTLQVNNGTYTEPTNSYFGNTFGIDGSLTIKPASGATPILNFTYIGAAPAGVIGHVVIGVTNGNAPDTSNCFSSNSKYIIDGSNTPGGITRNMTWIAGSPTTALATPMNYVVTVFGNNDNVIVKNMDIEIYDTSGAHAPIRWASGNVATLGGDILPDGGLLQNCKLVASYTGTGTHASGYGFATSVAIGTLTAGAVAGDLVIEKNEMYCKQRGIFLNAYGNITIRNNSIIMGGGTSTGYSYQGIFHFTANGNSGFVQNIYNNKINMTVPPVIATYSACGILCDSGVGTPPAPDMDGTYNIYNNTLESITFNPAYSAATDAGTYAISVNSVISDYIVEHNSFNIPSDAYLTGTTLGRIAGIRIPLAMTSGSVICGNNIIRMAQATTTPANVAVVFSANSLGLTFVGNDLVPTGGGGFGNIAGTPYLNLASWQAAGYDSVVSGGQSVDPTTTSPSWDSALHFLGYPVTGLGTVASSTILTDIDGDVRPATGAVPGADEPQVVTSAKTWSLY